MRDKVLRIISEYKDTDFSNVTDDANLKTDLGLDSFDLVELTCIFEEQFKHDISDEDMYDLCTVGDVVNLFKRNLQDGSVG